METLVRVLWQGPLQTRNWQSPNGEMKVINSVELECTNGIDGFICEATDSLAQQLAQKPLGTDRMYAAQLRMSVRRWTSKTTNNEVSSTTIRLLNINGV